MFSRRNTLIRTITAFTGDVATGVVLASTCVWIIQTAALGLFLSFLLWLLGMLLSLTISQYVIHPATQQILSDRKLDEGIAAVTCMVEVLAHLSGKARDGLWSAFRSSCKPA